MNALEDLVRASRRLSPRTKDAYCQGVRDFLSFAGGVEADWTPVNVERWVAHLEGRGLAAQTVNHYLAGLKWASQRRHLLEDARDFAAATETLRVTRKVNPNRALSADEARRLLATCAGDSWLDLRDRSIILLGMRAGLRRWEIAPLTWPCLQGSTLNVVGKGGRHETVLLDDAVLWTLSAWDHKSHARPSDFMFVRERPFLSGPPRALTTGGIYEVIVKRAKQAGISDVSPHTLRHTFATLLLEAGVEPWRVQLAMRHRGPAPGAPGSSGSGLGPVTQRYAHDDRPAGAALTVLDE